ncbi:MAG: carboxypeptidase-like regulatory domain-containing protein, partial [Acidobacteriota bacterium]|nr:carboxypeptidase-like regulatory domain-containing protein [Acidobacteriota bacterium]
MRNCIAVAICLVAGLTLFAQTDRGTITGTITDPGNAVIQGAKISLKSIETGAAYDTVTTSTGNYTLPSLPAGTYDLTVESPGFNRHVQTGITVQVAQTARIDIVMKLGATTDSVTINADAPLLKTESAEQSQTITEQRTTEIPLTSAAGGVRNPVAGLILAPGVQQSGFTIRVNGGINNTYKTLIDGQDVTTSGTDPSHLSEIQPSTDALEEVTLQASNFAAEFGQVAGGLINITSRSGTNRYHGSGYEYFTNEALNAGRPYTNNGPNGTLLRPRSRNNDFGFTVGGPLSIPKLYNGKDKTFFFFNLEEYRTTATGSGFTTVATDAYRNGDFSSVLTGRTLTDQYGNKIPEGAIFDPKTDAVVNGLVTRTQFPGNIIPPSRFDPVAVKIQALIPRATVPGALTNNLAIGDPTSRQTYIPSLKIDHFVSERTKLSFYVGDFWQNVPKSGADGLPYPVSSARNFIDRTPTFRLNLDETISPTLLVHVGLGELRYDHIDSSPASVLTYDAPGLLGLVGAGVTPSGFPQLGGLGGNQGGVSSTLGPVNANNYYNDKPTLVFSATKVSGNHTYKAGGELRRDIWEDINTRGAQGVYNFSPADTGLPYNPSLGGGSIGFSYASFLLGAVDNA